jgi:hypothetical protein
MQSHKLSELKQTIKELQKLDAFSEEEMLYLQDMDKSMAELAQEISNDPYEIGLINDSVNPDPVLVDGSLTLQADLPSEVLMFSPRESQIIQTSIKLVIPSTLAFQKNTPWELAAQGIIASEIYFADDYAFVILTNIINGTNTLRNGVNIIDLRFTFRLNNDTLIMKRMDS